MGGFRRPNWQMKRLRVPHQSPPLWLVPPLCVCKAKLGFLALARRWREEAWEWQQCGWRLEGQFFTRFTAAITTSLENALKVIAETNESWSKLVKRSIPAGELSLV